jgi:prevent-host-death family protein
MSEPVVTVEDASLHLAELVEHVSAKREAAVIVKAGRPVARIVPIPAPGELSDDLIDFLRRWRAQYPEPDEQLAEVIGEARRVVRPAHDPWE